MRQFKILLDNLCFGAGPRGHDNRLYYSPMTHKLLRVKQGGQVAERSKREQMPIACMLGGPARRTLFLLSSESIDPDACRAKRNARIETTEVEVAGAGWP